MKKMKMIEAWGTCVTARGCGEAEAVSAYYRDSLRTRSREADETKQHSCQLNFHDDPFLGSPTT
jgi:hypothetical protein